MNQRRPTLFVESNMVLAYIAKDREGVYEALRSMAPTEVKRFWHELSGLETLIGRYMTEEGIEH